MALEELTAKVKSIQASRSRDNKSSVRNKTTGLPQYEVSPSCPPSYAEAPSFIAETGSQATLGDPPMDASTFCPQTWREAKSAFPVFLDNQGNRFHEPLDLKSLKNLAESVQAYGVSANFTKAIISRFAYIAMTPQDWYNTVGRRPTSIQNGATSVPLTVDSCLVQA